MPGEPLAEASVRVRPDARDFKRELADEIEASGAGEQGDKQGRLFGSRFSDTAKKDIGKALAGLPDVKIDADSSPAQRKLAVLRGELAVLHEQEIGVDIDADLALTQIARIKAELLLLGRSSDIRIRFDAGAAAADLGDLVGKLGPTTAKSGASLGSGLGATAGPALIGAIGGALAFATPVLGAMVGGAVLGGVGAGGIVGGVAAAAQDPRVQSAGQQLGERLKERLADIGEPWVGEVLQGIGRIDGATAAWAANAKDDLAGLAPLVKPLSEGFAQAIARFDLGDLVDDVKPFVRLIADELPGLADALHDMLDDMESDGAIEGLAALFKIIESGLRSAGQLVGFLGDVHEGIVDVTSAVGDAADAFSNSNWQALAPGLIPVAAVLGEMGDGADSLKTSLSNARSTADDFQGDLEGVGHEAKVAADEIEGMSDAIDQLFGVQMSADEALANYRQGIRDLSKELSDGTRTLDENTQEGLNNAGAVRDQIQNIEDLRVAQFNQTGNLKAANAVYEQHIAQLRTTLLNLGYNKAQVEALIAAYKRIPKVVESEIRIRETFHGGGGAGGETHPLEHRAGGGGVDAYQPVVVGEDGDEVFVPDVPGTVIPHHQLGAFDAARAGAVASAGSTSGPSAEQIGAVVARQLGSGWVATVRARDGASQWLADFVEVRIERNNDRTAHAVAGGMR